MLAQGQPCQFDLVIIEGVFGLASELWLPDPFHIIDNLPGSDSRRQLRRVDRNGVTLLFFFLFGFALGFCFFVAVRFIFLLFLLLEIFLDLLVVLLLLGFGGLGVLLLQVGRLLGLLHLRPEATRVC